LFHFPRKKRASGGQFFRTFVPSPKPLTVPTFSEILKDIKQRKFAPVYVLHGDEPFYIDQVADAIEDKALPVHERGFNQFVLYGKDLQVASLLSHAKRFPMMAERQLVLVKEAQGIAGLNDKEALRFLEEYMRQPLASTLLVLCFKEPIDERKAWVKAAHQQGIVLISKKLYDNKLPDWIIDHCHQTGTKVSPKAVQMLVENVGNDLKRLASELDKIMLNLRAGEQIQADTVERFVGMSKDYNYFEYQKSLIQGDVLKANRIVQYFGKNPKDNPLPPMLILLYNFFSKVLIVHATPDKTEKNLAAVLGVNPFFVKDYLQAIRLFPLVKVVDIIHDIRVADGKSKGIDSGSLSDELLLSELTFRILH
jgi:DNA polymerase III subunit delta